MQAITANPRQNLSEAAVLALLTDTPTVEIRGGIEHYDSTLNFVADLSGKLQAGSSVSSDATAQIHRSCSLVLDADTPFNYLSDYIKPYLVMTDTLTGFTARFNLGVYSLTSPTPDLTLDPGTCTYTGYDLLSVLNQPIGDSYEIAAGAEPVAAVIALVTSAFPPGFNLAFSSEPSGTTTPAVLSWPFDGQSSATYLDVANAVLSMIGYHGLWVDQDGVFQIHPYKNPVAPTTAAEWIFDLSTAEGSVVSDSRSVFKDVFNTPNTWVYVMSNLTAAPVEGVTQFSYTDNVTPVTSVPARGRVVRKTAVVDALDYDTLRVVAAQDIENDLRPIETFAISTFPLPLFWHRDIVDYIDPALASLIPYDPSTRRALVVSWQLALDVSGGDMALTLATVSSAVTGAAGTT